MSIEILKILEKKDLTFSTWCCGGISIYGSSSYCEDCKKSYVKLVNDIDYYFNNENKVNDKYKLGDIMLLEKEKKDYKELYENVRKKYKILKEKITKLYNERHIDIIY